MALVDNLVAYWSLEEASGSRVDAHGANDLTDNNTVTSATGKVGDGASFARANSESLTIADNTDLSMGDVDFTIACWVYLADLNDYSALVTKDDAGANREYILYYDDAVSRISFGIWSGAGGAGNAEISGTTFGTPSTATWHFVVARHDATANTISICVNDGGVNSTSHSGGAYNGSAQFALGRFGGGLYHNGRMDEVGIWKRALSGAEITELYNAGSGRDYTYVSGGGGGSTIRRYSLSLTGVG
jgi:hypothetical protein